MISSRKLHWVGLVLILVAFIFAIGLTMFGASETEQTIGEITYGDGQSITFDKNDYYTMATSTSPIKITLSESGATSKSANVSSKDGEVTILAGGTYVLSGELSGSLIVDAADDATVYLMFNGVNVRAKDFAALYVKQAKKTVIATVEGTENFLIDAQSYNEEKTEDGAIDASLYSRDDLVICGKGLLSVIGNNADGIKVNDGLKVTSGTLAVQAVDDGIRAKDYLALIGGVVTVTAGGDGLKVKGTAEDAGFAALTGGTLTITSGGDGLYAASNIYLMGTTISVTSGGGASSSQKHTRESGFGNFGNRSFGREQTAKENSGSDTDSTKSAKALKADGDIIAREGDFVFDCADDALHAGGTITIEGGSMDIQTGDDGMHADETLYIKGGTLNIRQSYEGLEGKYIVIDGGHITVVSSDDGVNASGNGSSDMRNEASHTDALLTINGGSMDIFPGGDGLDANGAAVMNGGTVTVVGPSDSGNSSMDFDSTFTINGGVLLAAGSSGMAESPADASAQNALVVYLSSSYPAGSTVEISAQSGEIASLTSKVSFNWVCYSAPQLKMGASYKVAVDGIEEASCTLEDTITTVGNRNASWSMMQGGMRGGFGGEQGGFRENSSDSGEMIPRQGGFGRGMRGGMPSGEEGQSATDDQSGTKSDLPTFDGRQNGLRPSFPGEANDGERPDFPDGANGGERPSFPDEAIDGENRGVAEEGNNQADAEDNGGTRALLSQMEDGMTDDNASSEGAETEEVSETESLEGKALLGFSALCVFAGFAFLLFYKRKHY